MWLWFLITAFVIEAFNELKRNVSPLNLTSKNEIFLSDSLSNLNHALNKYNRFS